MALYKGTVPALLLCSHGAVQVRGVGRGGVSPPAHNEGWADDDDGTDGGHNRRALDRPWLAVVNRQASPPPPPTPHPTVATPHQFMSYEWLKSESQTLLGRQLNSTDYFVIGAAAKIIASVTTYPAQVIKTRLQQREQAPSFNALTGELKSKEYQWIKYRGTIDCAIKIYHHEGPYGFFKGCAPNAIRVAPGAAIFFVIYEGGWGVERTGGRPFACLVSALPPCPPLASTPGLSDVIREFER